MKARTLLLVLVAAVVAAAPATSGAQSTSDDPVNPPGREAGGLGHRGGPGGGFERHLGLGFFERMLPQMAEEIGLSDEQVAEIEAIVDEARPTIESYRHELRANREAYRAEHGDPAVFDEGAFRSHFNAQHVIQTNLMVALGQTRAEVYSVLTPEQREALDELRADRGRGLKRHSGGRRGN